MNRSPLLSRSGRFLSLALDAPDFVGQVQALPNPGFAALVRRIGVEDAGELLAVATTAQLAAAFDEDFFTSDAPGERELAYLANVLVAGAPHPTNPAGRHSPREAIEAALATVQLGVLLELGDPSAPVAQCVELLRECSADRLFRRAAGAVPNPPQRT